MASGNPYAKYANNKVLTASPAELTLMLYEGAIKFCNLAKIDMEKGEYGGAMEHVKKARNIIVELQTTLDFKYPAAKDFDLIYSYVFDRLTESNTKHDIEALEQALEEIRELRDIWKQLMKIGK